MGCKNYFFTALTFTYKGVFNMNVFYTIILFIIGLILIVKGGDYFVDASGKIAEASGIPKFIVGATVVSFATTLPELIVSVIAASQGKASLASGNAIGSVTANMGLILGLSIVCIPSVVKRKSIALKGFLMIFSCFLLTAFCYGGTLKLWHSIILLLMFFAFMAENVISAKSAIKSNVPASKSFKPLKTAFYFIIGCSGIIFGADMLVNNGSKLAQIIGIPESIIGVTVIAIGTSLPELVTTITAIIKKEASLSIGNIVGANIIDLTVILPVCSIISGGSLNISAQNTALDLPVCFLLSLIAILPPVLFKKFKRIQGISMLAVYIIYIYLLCSKFI